MPLNTCVPSAFLPPDRSSSLLGSKAIPYAARTTLLAGLLVPVPKSYFIGFMSYSRARPPEQQVSSQHTWSEILKESAALGFFKLLPNLILVSNSRLPTVTLNTYKVPITNPLIFDA